MASFAFLLSGSGPGGTGNVATAGRFVEERQFPQHHRRVRIRTRMHPGFKLGRFRMGLHRDVGTEGLRQRHYKPEPDVRIL